MCISIVITYTFEEIHSKKINSLKMIKLIHKTTFDTNRYVFIMGCGTNMIDEYIYNYLIKELLTYVYVFKI